MGSADNRPLTRLLAACETLLSDVGEASMRTVAMEALTAYADLGDDGKLQFFAPVCTAYDVDAEQVEARHRREHAERDEPALEADEPLEGGKVAQVVDKHDRVEGVVEGVGDEVPRGVLVRPERAERAVHPHDVPAGLRDHRRELRRHERDRQRPDPGQHEQAEERETRAGGADRVLDAVVAAAHREEGDPYQLRTQSER